jgi:small subunit ribosomal protein S8
MDVLSDALSTIMNNEMRNKRECILSPASKLIGSILRVLQQTGYIGKFELIDDGRFGKFEVQLLGRINKCGAIRPRYFVKLKNIEDWERKFLPSRDFGILILSTSGGVLTHRDAKQKRVGGVLLGYVF